MAQNSVHLTQTLQPKPSIFEVIASDSLQTTFQPAFKRIFHVSSQHQKRNFISESNQFVIFQYLANVNPQRYGWLYQYFDEFYLCLNTVIQRHYLRSYGGSLAEVFYSLTRIRSKTDEFNDRDRFISFICVVILPYINSKLNNIIQKWSNEIDDGVPLTPKIERRKKFVVKYYKKLNGIYDLLQCFQTIAYLANISKSHSILNRLIGIHLNYLPPDPEMQWSWSDFLTGKLKSSTIVSSFIFRGLELSAFFLQFIQWWQNETTNGSLTKLPSPEAPINTLKAGGSRYLNLCPICLQRWKTPTVNRISG